MPAIFVRKRGVATVKGGWGCVYRGTTALKDRQLLVGGVLGFSPFLCMYLINIHMLYIN